MSDVPDPEDAAEAIVEKEREKLRESYNHLWDDEYIDGLDWSEDKLESQRETIAEPTFSADELAEGIEDIAGYYSEHTDAKESSIHAAAAYGLLRMVRSKISRKEVADVYGVSANTITRHWRDAIEVSARKDHDVEIDSDYIMEKA